MTEDCAVTVDVRANGMPTCSDILYQWELLIDEFYAMNPSVGADCAGMWAGMLFKAPPKSRSDDNGDTGYQYCVRTNDWVPPVDTTEPSATSTVSSTSTSPPTTNPTPPGPVQEGQPSDCNKWHLVEGKQPRLECGTRTYV